MNIFFSFSLKYFKHWSGLWERYYRIMQIIIRLNNYSLLPGIYSNYIISKDSCWWLLCTSFVGKYLALSIWKATQHLKNESHISDLGRFWFFSEVLLTLESELWPWCFLGFLSEWSLITICVRPARTFQPSLLNGVLTVVFSDFRETIRYNPKWLRRGGFPRDLRELHRGYLTGAVDTSMRVEPTCVDSADWGGMVPWPPSLTCFLSLCTLMSSTHQEVPGACWWRCFTRHDFCLSSHFLFPVMSSP